MTSNVENYKGVLDGRLGFGQKAAVLVIDFTKASLGKIDRKGPKTRRKPGLGVFRKDVL